MTEIHFTTKGAVLSQTEMDTIRTKAQDIRVRNNTLEAIASGLDAMTINDKDRKEEIMQLLADQFIAITELLGMTR